VICSTPKCGHPATHAVTDDDQRIYLVICVVCLGVAIKFKHHYWRLGK